MGKYVHAAKQPCELDKIIFTSNRQSTKAVEVPNSAGMNKQCEIITIFLYFLLLLCNTLDQTQGIDRSIVVLCM